MRGVITFMVAMFVLPVYFLVLNGAIEPLIEIVLTFDLTPVNGAAKVEILRDILFLWAPFVYLAAWFAWGAYYYVRQNLFVGQTSGGVPRR